LTFSCQKNIKRRIILILDINTVYSRVCVVYTVDVLDWFLIAGVAEEAGPTVAAVAVDEILAHSCSTHT
jgi:hypothetical protein